MRSWMARAAGLIMAGAITFMTGTTMAEAETHTETIVTEQRTTFALQGNAEAVQALLPAGWTLNAAPGGPNITLIFMDRKLALTPDGKPLQGGMNRLLVVAVAAKNAQGEARTLIVGGYSADPSGVPGAYKVYAGGEVAVARTEMVKGGAANTVDEHWTVKGADGGAVDVKVSFVRGVPTSGPFEQKVHSGADPDFYRIYRGEQATEVLRNPAGGVDHVKSVSVKASGGKLGKAVGDTAKVIAVSNAPFYGRKTYLP